MTDRNDNARVKRYIAKYTINPAIAQGFANEIGSVSGGQTGGFGTMVAGILRREARSDHQGWLHRVRAQWAIPTRRFQRRSRSTTVRCLVRLGRAMAASCITFVSTAAIDAGDRTRPCNCRRTLAAVSNTRGGIGKQAMIHNDATPVIEVDAETYEVRADGVLLTCEPATRSADGTAVFSVLIRVVEILRQPAAGIRCGRSIVC